MPTRPQRVRIVGLGLIGGSLGRALVRAGWTVEFLDPAVDEAEARRVSAATKRLEAIDPADGSPIVLATPVDVAIRMLETTSFGRVPVTSVGSVMAPLARAAAERSLAFVAGHPFAGKETRGLAFAEADLFAGRRWFLDASREDPLVDAIVTATGAVVHRIDPASHDRIVALTSHLPQILSTALGALVAERKIDDAFLGQGLATMLRLAGSDHAIWRPIIGENRRNLEAAERDLRRILERILDGDSAEAFELARATHGRIKAESRRKKAEDTDLNCEKRR